jgi:hypothetical protein
VQTLEVQAKVQPNDANAIFTNCLHSNIETYFQTL